MTSLPSQPRGTGPLTPQGTAPLTWSWTGSNENKFEVKYPAKRVPNIEIEVGPQDELMQETLPVVNKGAQVLDVVPLFEDTSEIVINKADNQCVDLNYLSGVILNQDQDAFKASLTFLDDLSQRSPESYSVSELARLKELGIPRSQLPYIGQLTRLVKEDEAFIQALRLNLGDRKGQQAFRQVMTALESLHGNSPIPFQTSAQNELLAELGILDDPEMSKNVYQRLKALSETQLKDEQARPERKSLARHIQGVLHKGKIRRTQKAMEYLLATGNNDLRKIHPRHLEGLNDGVRSLFALHQERVQNLDDYGNNFVLDLMGDVSIMDAHLDGMPVKSSTADRRMDRMVEREFKSHFREHGVTDSQLLTMDLFQLAEENPDQLALLQAYFTPDPQDPNWTHPPVTAELETALQGLGLQVTRQGSEIALKTLGGETIENSALGGYIKFAADAPPEARETMDRLRRVSDNLDVVQQRREELERLKAEQARIQAEKKELLTRQEGIDAELQQNNQAQAQLEALEALLAQAKAQSQALGIPLAQLLKRPEYQALTAFLAQVDGATASSDPAADIESALKRKKTKLDKAQQKLKTERAQIDVQLHELTQAEKNVNGKLNHAKTVYKESVEVLVESQQDLEDYYQKNKDKLPPEYRDFLGDLVGKTRQAVLQELDAAIALMGDFDPAWADQLAALKDQLNAMVEAMAGNFRKAMTVPDFQPVATSFEMPKARSESTAEAAQNSKDWKPIQAQNMASAAQRRLENQRQSQLYRQQQADKQQQAEQDALTEYQLQRADIERKQAEQGL